MRAEGFSCSLGVLYEGLGISKLQFLIKIIKILISSSKFFSTLCHQTLVPDPGSGSAIRKNAGSGSALNQCGSATLMPGAAGGAARLLHPLGALPRRPQPPPPKQREGAAGRPAQGAGADPPPGMEFFGHKFYKRLESSYAPCYSQSFY